LKGSGISAGFAVLFQQQRFEALAGKCSSTTEPEPEPMMMASYSLLYSRPGSGGKSAPVQRRD
jgi:hypothetical protein